MSSVCPNGHTSAADDYCDVCGSPIATAAEGTPGAAPAGAPVSPAPEPPAEAASSGMSAPTGRSAVVSGSAPAGEVAPAGQPGEAAAGSVTCPNCSTENAVGALFCEACGYDFTTGAMPSEPAPSAAPAEPATSPSTAAAAASGGPAGSAAAGGAEGSAAASAPARADWVAEAWVDPDWYASQEVEDPCPSPGLPRVIPLHGRSVLLGRVSVSRNTHPEIDLSSDPGVSRRHAQLTTDGTRWFVEDLASSNGTYVGPASGPLPEQAIPVGPKTELGDDDRLYVGAWTRVVIRKATQEEAAQLAS